MDLDTTTIVAILTALGVGGALKAAVDKWLSRGAEQRATAVAESVEDRAAAEALFNRAKELLDQQRDELALWRSENAALRAEIKELRDELSEAREEIAELRAELERNGLRPPRRKPHAAEDKAA
jgi:chromosome segregation ATPase